MMVPSRHWASQVDATTREFINARIAEELKPLRDDIEAIRSALLVIREGSQRDTGELTARVNDVEALLNMSTARVARLRQMADEEVRNGTHPRTLQNS